MSSHRAECSCPEGGTRGIIEPGCPLHDNAIPTVESDEGYLHPAPESMMRAPSVHHTAYDDWQAWRGWAARLGDPAGTTPTLGHRLTSLEFRLDSVIWLHAEFIWSVQQVAIKQVAAATAANVARKLGIQQ